MPSYGELDSYTYAVCLGQGLSCLKHPAPTLPFNHPGIHFTAQEKGPNQGDRMGYVQQPTEERGPRSTTRRGERGVSGSVVDEGLSWPSRRDPAAKLCALQSACLGSVSR